MQAQSGIDFLEGVHVEGEIANVITPRKGSETVNSWIIGVLEHEDVVDYTGMYGRSCVRGVTVAFGFASTLDYLRRAISVDEFGGGLMHRFLVAHESKMDDRDEAVVLGVEFVRLGEALKDIAAKAPATLALAPTAKRRLDLLAKQPKYFGVHQLQGWWNRFDGIVLKVAMLFALARGRGQVEVEDVERAEGFLRYRLYPPLEGVVEQLAAPREKKVLLDLADDLWTSGPKGWALDVLYRKLGKANPKAQVEALNAMEEQGLLFRGKRGVQGGAKVQWVWATKEWRAAAQPEEPTPS